MLDVYTVGFPLRKNSNNRTNLMTLKIIEIYIVIICTTNNHLEQWSCRGTISRFFYTVAETSLSESSIIL